MSYTPVELRHVRIGRGLFGYRRSAVEQLLLEVADSFEEVWRERGELSDEVEELKKTMVELRRREELLAHTLVAAENTASEVRDQAKREAELIVGEAHQEARSITRGAQGEQSRLAAEIRRMEALLRAALGMVEEGGAQPVQEPAPEAKAETVERAERTETRVETWPRRDDTMEFPRPRSVPELRTEPEARAG